MTCAAILTRPIDSGLWLPQCVHVGLQADPVERLHRQIGEHPQASLQFGSRTYQRLAPLGRILVLIGVRAAPVRGDGVPRPDRRCFAGGGVAQREYEIQRRRVRRAELAYVLWWM